MSTDKKQAFHVLALSGGGFRGLYTATILANLETALGAPLASKFDLICGTSVGGVLALGLAKGIPANELQAMFLEQGRQIFRRRFALGGLGFLSRHKNKGLQGALESKFGHSTMGDLISPVLVPAVNYTTGLPRVFKTPHHRSLEVDYGRSLVDVGLATSAAPTYFPIHAMEDGKYVDGGLIANTPGQLGLHEATEYFGVHEDSVGILSIGTMSVGTTIRGNSFLSRGFMLWRSELFDLMISAQEAQTHSVLKHRLKERYLSVDDTVQPEQARDIKNLSKVSKKAIDTLVTRGNDRSRWLLGDPGFQKFREHQSQLPVFYHGSNKATERLSA